MKNKTKNDLKVQLKSALVLVNDELENIKVCNHIPGMSVSIVSDKKLIWAKGFGYANLEKKIPATARTIYRIGSITKLFTAIMLMQLRDARKLRLDDPIEKYISVSRFGTKFVGSNSPTLGQLAAHISGLPMEGPQDYWNTFKFPSVKEMSNSLKLIELVFPPMTKVKYSNLGYALLGHILEIISGVSFEKYVQNQILSPLNMKNTFFHNVHLNEKLKNSIANGYIINGTKIILAPSINLQGFTPAGQLSSSVEDISHLISLQFIDYIRSSSNKKILSNSSISEMHLIHSIERDWSCGYGIGWMMEKCGEYTIWEHGGKLPGFSTAIAFIPEIKIGIAFFANTSSIWPYNVIRNIFNLLMPVIKRIHDRDLLSSFYHKDKWSRYTGKYNMNNFFQLEIKLINNKLFMFEEFKKPCLLVPLDENKFRISEGDKDGELAVFEINYENDVIALTTGGGTHFKKIISYDS